MDKKKKKQIPNNQTIDYFLKKKNIEKPKQVTPSPLAVITKKKKAKKSKDFHESSREGSAFTDKTQKIQSDRQQIPEAYVCQQFIMIGPTDVYYYGSIKKRFQKLLDNYSKVNFIKTVKQNAKYTKIKDLRNLQEIQDDDFWSLTAPKMIDLICNPEMQEKISSCVEIMVNGRGKMIGLNKLQIFLMMANMLLCSFPRQIHRANLNFTQLMGTKQNDSQKNRLCRKEKLKCIINYFNQIIKRTQVELEADSVEIQRVRNVQSLQIISQIGCELKDVQVMSGHIQDYYKESIMVDFANKNIGGGILGNGAVQQEIMFCVFPQLIATMCLCPQLDEDQALIFYDMERFNNYKGYSSDFQFTGTYEKGGEGARSIIVAIDAVDYKSKIKNTQFMPRQVIRELKKALAGFEGVEMGAESDMWICTGRWGCGAYSGDIYLKFLIQWIGCSFAKRNMIYLAQDQEEKKELKRLINFVKDRYISSQILEVIKDYNEACKDGCRSSFLEFFKFQI